MCLQRNTRRGEFGARLPVLSASRAARERSVGAPRCSTRQRLTRRCTAWRSASVTQLLKQQTDSGGRDNTGGYVNDAIRIEVMCEFVVLLDEMIDGLAAR